MSGLAETIALRTPPTRDRALDAMRALAIFGVVAGHWMGSAWSPTLRISSPLVFMPELVPLTWLFQMLAVFFLVGGYVAARGAHDAAWVGARMRRLLTPVLPLLAVWAAALAIAAPWVPYRTLRAFALPALGPLWFLAVFAALTALTPWLVKLVRVRHAVWLVVALVAVVDVGRFMVAPWLGWVNVGAAWLVPYLLGLVWARDGLSRRAAGWIAAGGALATVALVGWFGYPASMVGVTGARVSNLSPPTLAAVTFGLAQAGLAVLVRPALGRLMRRPRLWAVVALANLHAMRVFVWHMTVLVAVVVLFGLYGTPSTWSWLGSRLLLVVALASAAVLMTWCRQRFDFGRRSL
ncbi:acyltransferase [Nonomuraea sp. NPDC050663]|uniref:acyltransferase n=1 Tax=Nonomuraea sp. NPDC050663 TaxID=3364370 RepID=UPI0037B71ED8